MKKYLVLFTGVFMFSACCAAPVRQVDMYGESPNYYVSIKSYPRHHYHPIVVRPIPPKHIVHTPPPPTQFKPSKPNPSPHHHHGGKR